MLTINNYVNESSNISLAYINDRRIVDYRLLAGIG